MTIVGFPFAFGNGNLSDEGALEPISGIGEMVSFDGLSHEESSCWKVMIAMRALLELLAGEVC